MRATVVLVAALAACGSSHTARSAQEAAARGAVAGAAGGIVSALIFGGDPVERAARGAAWGAGAGAAASMMLGGEKDKRRQEAEAEIAKLRKEIGEDCYEGLEALADCRHDVALAYARTAAKASNDDYRTAALWLEVLVYMDKRDMEGARARFDGIVEHDEEIRSVAEAEQAARKAIETLRDVREEYGLPRDCK